MFGKAVSLVSMSISNAVASHRQKQIVTNYLKELDAHMEALRRGEADRTLEIREFAQILHIHPVHLSQTIKEVTGKSTCDHYEERLLSLASDLLLNTDWPIARVAEQLTYDPSNFTKFFKAYTGMTPRQFRNGS